MGDVSLTPDTQTAPNGLTRYFLVIYGPEGTALDWAYAEGNNDAGSGFFDAYWYTSDRGVTWAEFGEENPFFLRVSVGLPCPEDQRVDSSCVFLTDTGGDPRIDVRGGACDEAQNGAPVDIITGDRRLVTEAVGFVSLTGSTCGADDAPLDRVTVTNVLSRTATPRSTSSRGVGCPSSPTGARHPREHFGWAAPRLAPDRRCVTSRVRTPPERRRLAAIGEKALCHRDRRLLRLAPGGPEGQTAIAGAP